MYIIIYLIFLDSEQSEVFIRFTMIYFHFNFYTQKFEKREYYNHDMFLNFFGKNLHELGILKRRSIFDFPNIFNAYCVRSNNRKLI